MKEAEVGGRWSTNESFKWDEANNVYTNFTTTAFITYKIWGPDLKRTGGTCNDMLRHMCLYGGARGFRCSGLPAHILDAD